MSGLISSLDAAARFITPRNFVVTMIVITLLFGGDDAVEFARETGSAVGGGLGATWEGVQEVFSSIGNPSAQPGLS